MEQMSTTQPQKQVQWTDLNPTQTQVVHHEATIANGPPVSPTLIAQKLLDNLSRLS
jgi:hypothetical protein